MKRWMYFLPLVLLLGLSAFFFKGLYLDPREVPSALIEKPAPDYEMAVMPANGRSLKKADLIGKVYMINVWSSWCEACRYEHPYLVELKSAGKLPLMVGLDYRDKAPAGMAWLRRFGNPYDIIVQDPEGRESFNFGVYGVPETFVIDKKGVIRYKHVGPVNPEAWEKKIEPIIKHLEKQ